MTHAISTAILIILAIGSLPPIGQADEATACPQSVPHFDGATPEKAEHALLLDQAGACIRAGRATEAITLFNELLRIDPRDAFSYMNRGTMRIAVGDIELGMSDLNSAINLRPDLMEAWYNRGNAQLIHLHRFEGAIADFDEVIRQRPDFALAYCSRGLAKLQLGESNNALADYNQGIERDPKQTYCHFNRGNLFLAEREYQKAISDFSAALSGRPADAMTLSGRAQAYEALGQRDQALADYRGALNLDPTLESAKDGIGRLGASPN
jgi:tetratricopeptide (TPR) repeat protein